MVLGIYYLTKAKPGAKGEGRAFGSLEEVILALEAGEVELLTPIRLRYTGELIDLATAYDDQDVPHAEPVTLKRQFINTTVGRVIFNDHLPKEMPFINGLIKKKGVQQLVLLLLPALRPGAHRAAARRAQGTRLPLRHQVRHLHRHRRHAHPRRQSRPGGRHRKGNRQGAAAIPGRRHHQRRALQQSHRHLERRHRKSRRADVQGPGAARTKKASSIRFTSWPIPAPADRNSRSASFPVCAA